MGWPLCENLVGQRWVIKAMNQPDAFQVCHSLVQKWQWNCSRQVIKGMNDGLSLALLIESPSKAICDLIECVDVDLNQHSGCSSPTPN